MMTITRIMQTINPLVKPSSSVVEKPKGIGGSITIRHMVSMVADNTPVKPDIIK